MLIGLTGFKRSGKDSTANILAEYGFERYAFAAALRTIALESDPLVSLDGAPDELRDQFTYTKRTGRHATHLVRRSAVRYSELLNTVGYEAAKDVPDFRQYLQKLGTQGVRAVFGADAWVSALEHRLIEEEKMEPGTEDNYPSLRHGERVTVTDVRFPNENEWVRDCGGEVWRIVRPGFGGDDQHESERYIADLEVDLEITATNLDELGSLVRNAVALRFPEAAVA